MAFKAAIRAGALKTVGSGRAKEETGREHVHADIYAKTAEEARRAALEAVEAERRQMMAEIEERRQEARKEALEEHTRLMGLAGTPEFRPEADMEVFNNIERIVTDWRILAAEGGIQDRAGRRS